MNIPINIEALLAPEEDAAQSRLARLVLSHMTSDPLVSAVVFTEINTDGRGSYVALTELVLALTRALSESWTRDATPAAITTFLREQLARLESKEQAHD